MDIIMHEHKAIIYFREDNEKERKNRWKGEKERVLKMGKRELGKAEIKEGKGGERKKGGNWKG